MTPALMAQLHALAFSHQRVWSAAEFEGFLDSRLCFAVGDARGFALVRVAAEEAELLTLATHPEHRRRGVARTLMQDWEQEARGRGAQDAHLEVAADNTAAKALYTSCGYGLVGERTGYYTRSDGSVVDAVLMYKPLT